MNYNTKENGNPQDLDDKSALDKAYSLVSRLSWTVPGQRSHEEVMSEITNTFDLSLDDLALVRSFLSKLVSERRKLISSVWHINNENVVKCDKLPAYDPSWQNGITFIRSPMGSGKSKHIAAPFINESMNRRYTIASTPSKALCHEQAAKFGIDLYSDVSGQGYASPAMSVCLPSLDKHGLQEQIGGASSFIFDEWSQSLALLAASGVCNADDFEKLTSICRTMDAGIFADAFLSDFDIEFVTSIMKPGLPVRIYDVADQNQGFRARHTYGSKARAWIIHEILKELHNGGKCWVSCEGRRSSQTIGEILQQDGHRVLIINKMTCETKNVKAFLDNTEEKCLQYDVIIHSPTITSGMSITGEKHGNHFTRGFFLGSGTKLQPKICTQMLRRVRYIREWSIGIAPNNGAQTISDASEDRQVYEIEQMTGQSVEGRQSFKRQIEQRDTNQKADFASAMIWMLEDMLFSLERVPCIVSSDLSDQVTETANRLDEEAKASILSAPDLTEDEANELRRADEKTPSDHHALTAFDIRAGFGVETLTPEIVDFYDEGRGLHRLQLFMDANGITYKETNHDRALNDNSKIRRELYAYVFEGIDITGTITRQTAEIIIDRVMARRFALAAFGCVPGKWGRIVELTSKRQSRKREDKNGHISDFPRPSYPMSEITEIFKMMGIVLDAGPRYGRCGISGRSKIVNNERLELIHSLSECHMATYILGKRGNVAPSETVETNHVQINLAAEFVPPEPEPNHNNENYSPKESAAREKVSSIMSRFIGWPTNGFADVWLPVSDEYGFQKTMTVPVPICVTLDETYDCVIETKPGSQEYLAFPFDAEAEPVIARLIA
ncbi:hypothetical protein HK11_08925 [Acetobacter sp. DmW_043]|uniref:hypothetical protein n=1 Tax=Acetobacter sp. DmW_043 TaxID=1670658 RepID=UPI000A3CDE23|nr:hypothetical protein [Acetobacter sp. DmW_043]OUI87916.1 hypothetical protein HK11_08925 [Acetobacter sp. DmW_043]